MDTSLLLKRKEVESRRIHRRDDDKPCEEVDSEPELETWMVKHGAYHGQYVAVTPVYAVLHEPPPTLASARKEGGPW